MIDLITGLPGNGKTLYALQLVEARARKENRPVFYARIKGLALPWTLIDPFEWAKCPPSAIIVIDECQQSADPDDPKSPSLFGVRQRGAVVPPWAAALETHRHKGIDLVLITQDPMLLDTHDRKLVRTHFHVVRTFGLARATVHEFQGCKPDVARSRQGSIRHEWRYPKEVFKWYTSAEVHTGKARVPMRVWLLLAMPLIIGGLSWWAWSRYISPESKVAKVAAAAVTSPSTATAVSAGKSVREYVAEQSPRIEGLAFSAPVFDQVTKPVAAPYPAACVASATWCRCWTQQGTRLEVPGALCSDIVRKGFFVAWAQPTSFLTNSPGRGDPRSGEGAALGVSGGLPPDDKLSATVRPSAQGPARVDVSEDNQGRPGRPKPKVP